MRKDIYKKETTCLSGWVEFVLLCRASLIQPAPAELPQNRKVARVGGRSGVI